MKRFFIFAAMLLTLEAYAGSMQGDPPPVTPGKEHIILVPQGLHDDIDRTIALCEYLLNTATGMIELTCYGTGADTEIMIITQDGICVDTININPDICPVAQMNIPSISGRYYIILRSCKYYGESSFYVA